MLSEEEYVKQWQKEMSDKKLKAGANDLMLLNEENAIITEKGERVRSKSEKIIADRLYHMGIPYCYEVPLNLRGYGWIKPDFNTLNKRTTGEFYWEHFGLMGNKDYCENAIRKIELYEKNGIFQGEKLIITYETENHPLNDRLVQQLIERFLY